MSKVIKQVVDAIKLVSMRNAVNHFTLENPTLYTFVNAILVLTVSFVLGFVVYYALNNNNSGSIGVIEVFINFYNLEWHLALAYIAAGVLAGIVIELFIVPPVARPVRRAIAKWKGSDFDYAMTYIFDGDQYRGFSGTFGWGAEETDKEIFLKWMFIIIAFPVGLLPLFELYVLRRRRSVVAYILYNLSKSLYGGKFRARRIIDNHLKAYDLLMPILKEDDPNVGNSIYYQALILELLGRESQYETLQPIIIGLLKKSIDKNVNNADIQLGMFFLQYADVLADKSIDGVREGVNILQSAISKPSCTVDIRNMCSIAIAKCLSDSGNVEDLKSAIAALDRIDLTDKKTVKFLRGDVYVKDCQKSRATRYNNIQKEESLKNQESPYHMNWFDAGSFLSLQEYSINMDHTSLSSLRVKLNLKLANAREIALIKSHEDEKRKATENLMAMFAHKFRGPVDSIIFNTQHKHDERIYLDAARTMTGLLEVFSIVSTEPENLAEAMRNDLGGTGSPEKTILRSLKLALMQLLSQRNIKRMSRHYCHHARRSGLVPGNVSFKEWATQPEMTMLEKEIQEKLEMEVSVLSIENGATDLADWMQSNLFATTIEVADDSQIRFAEYGRKEALLITIITEVLVNAVKHTDVTSSQPLRISWKEEGQTLVFECTNPSNRDSRSGVSRGSGKGHLFLKSLLEKMQGEFKPDVYKDLSSVHITIPSDLLKGAAK